MLQSTFKTDSRIWDANARKVAFGRVAVESARLMKDATRLRMVKSRPTGKVYEKKTRGSNFTRFHRASARGQRPAVDTGNLANKSLKSQRTGELSAEFFVDTNQARYAEKLQFELMRQIVNNDDVRIANTEYNFRANKALVSLL